MQFTTLTNLVSVLLVSIFSLAFAQPVTLDARDVYAPPVLYPHTGTIWKVGNHHNVTWDTSNPPVNITNKIGMIMLVKGGIATPLILEKGFNILISRIEVQVPWVIDGDDYQVVLFGDSGNRSQFFTIEA